MSASATYSCARRRDNTLICFGTTPAEPPAGQFVDLSCARSHCCALSASGSVSCFGMNDFGECTVPPAAVPARAISAGWQHTCTLRRIDGTGHLQPDVLFTMLQDVLFVLEHSGRSH